MSVPRPSRGSHGMKIVIKSFAKECLVKDAYSYALEFDTYLIYHNFCMANGLLPRDVDFFHSTFKSLIRGPEESSICIGKKEYPVYLGVKLNMSNPTVRKFNPIKLNQAD